MAVTAITAMQATLASIAESLRAERLRAGFTLEHLARRSDLSTAYLSRLESGERQPSLAALVSLARALGVSVGTLLGERVPAPALALFPDERPDHVVNGLAVAVHSGFQGSRALDALRLVIEPDREPPAAARHNGEEWIHVVSGRLVLEYDRQRYVVERGMSAHFDADRPHRLAADGSTTELLMVCADAQSSSALRTSIAARHVPTSGRATPRLHRS
jgi:transcriptional regulator with XRE-family HTH domain